MFFILSKILDLLISPIIWIIGCIVIAFLLRNKKAIISKKLYASAVMAILFFTNPFIVNWVMNQWEVSAYSSEEIKTPYEVGVVLGGSTRYYDNVSKRMVFSGSVDRLMQAVDLYHHGKIKKIFLSGGSGFVNFQDWKESEKLYPLLVSCGVKPEDILMENISRNTYENAIETAKVLKQKGITSKCLLITSAFHMRRSLACCAKANLKVDAYSVDVRSGGPIFTLDRLIQPDPEALVAWDLLTHEWVGYLVYRLMGYC
jgi:uncharacterized SAM-binding protein YcdF (DUF218 family)